MVKKFFKYSLVGVGGTLIDFSTLIFQVEILAFNIYVALIISFLLAATFNHFFNRKYTFKTTSQNIRHEYIKFILVSLIGITINLTMVYILFDLLTIHYILAKIIATGFVLLWNFLMNYHWTFKGHGNI